MYCLLVIEIDYTCIV